MAGLARHSRKRHGKRGELLRVPFGAEHGVEVFGRGVEVRGGGVCACEPEIWRVRGRARVGEVESWVERRDGAGRVGLRAEPEPERAPYGIAHGGDAVPVDGEAV